MEAGSAYEVLKPHKHEVIKPGMTSLVPSILLCWMVCAAGYLFLFQHLDVDLKVVGFAVAVVLIVSVAITTILLVLQKRRSLVFKILLACTFCLLGVLLAVLGALKVTSFAPGQAVGTQKAVFVLAEDTQSTTRGYKARAIYLEEIDGSQKDSEIASRVAFARMFGKSAVVTLYLNDAEGLLEGSIVCGSATFAGVGDAYAQNMWQSGITYSATLSSYSEITEGGLLGSIRSLRKHAITAFSEHGGEQAGILQAIVCGYKASIKSDGTYDKFKISGLAHLVAVSGAHLAIVSAAFVSVLKLLRASRRFMLVAVSFFVVAYLVFAGVPISAIRASIMILLSMSAWIFSRRSASLNALAICVLIFLILDPVSAVSVSLFLSAGSTLGIILFAGLIASWMPAKSKVVSDFIVAPISLTMASNIETLPFSAAMFSQVSLVAPLANVVAAGFFTLSCTVGLVCAVIALVVSPIAPIAIGFAAICTWPLQTSVNLLSSIPYASVAVSANAVVMICVSVLISVVLWKTFPKFHPKVFMTILFALFVCCAVLVFFVPRLAVDEIKMLDVGQGDSTLIRSQGGAVLIDTGNKDSLLREAIGSSAVYELEAVFISHADADHCESLESLAGYVNIKAIYVASDLLSCTCSNCEDLVAVSRKIVGEDNIVGLNKGDSVKLGRFSFEVLSPYVFNDDGGNADSLVLLCRYDFESDGIYEWNTLFTGDAEAEVLQSLTAESLVGDIDILKVPHHGSKAGLTEELLNTLQPEVALIGVGATNRYGHPTQTALELLESIGAHVYRTDLNSNISIKFKKESLSVVADESS